MVLPDGPRLSARGADTERFPELPDAMAAKIGRGDAYVIMPQRSFESLQQESAILASVLLRSRGSGPEGDTAPSPCARRSTLNHCRRRAKYSLQAHWQIPGFFV